MCHRYAPSLTLSNLACSFLRPTGKICGPLLTLPLYHLFPMQMKIHPHTEINPCSAHAGGPEQEKLVGLGWEKSSSESGQQHGDRGKPSCEWGPGWSALSEGMNKFKLDCDLKATCCTTFFIPVEMDWEWPLKSTLTRAVTFRPKTLSL